MKMKHEESKPDATGETGFFILHSAFGI